MTHEPTTPLPLSLLLLCSLATLLWHCSDGSPETHSSVGKRAARLSHIDQNASESADQEGVAPKKDEKVVPHKDVDFRQYSEEEPVSFDDEEGDIAKKPADADVSCVKGDGAFAESELVDVSIKSPPFDTLKGVYDQVALKLKHKTLDYAFYDLKSVDEWKQKGLTLNIPKGEYEVRMMLTQWYNDSVTYGTQFCSKLKKGETITISDTTELDFKLCPFSYAGHEVSIEKRLAGADRFLDIGAQEFFVMPPYQEITLMDSTSKTSSRRYAVDASVSAGFRLQAGNKYSSGLLTVSGNTQAGVNVADTLSMEIQYDIRMMLQKYDPYGHTELLMSKPNSSLHYLKVNEGYPFNAQCMIIATANRTKIFSYDGRITTSLNIDRDIEKYVWPLVFVGISVSAGASATVTWDKDERQVDMVSHTFQSNFTKVLDGDSVEGLWKVCTEQVYDAVKEKINKSLDDLVKQRFYAANQDQAGPALFIAIDSALNGPPRGIKDIHGYNWGIMPVSTLQDLGDRRFMVQGIVVAVPDIKKDKEQIPLRFTIFMKKNGDITEDSKFERLDPKNNASTLPFEELDLSLREAFIKLSAALAFAVYKRDIDIPPATSTYYKDLAEFKKPKLTCGVSNGQNDLEYYFREEFPYLSEEKRFESRTKHIPFSVSHGLKESDPYLKSQTSEVEIFPLVCGQDHLIKRLNFKRHIDTKDYLAANIECAYSGDDIKTSRKALGLDSDPKAVIVGPAECVSETSMDQGGQLVKDRVLSGLRLQWDPKARRIVDMFGICSKAVAEDGAIKFVSPKSEATLVKDVSVLDLTCPEGKAMAGVFFQHKLIDSQSAVMIADKSVQVGSPKTAPSSPNDRLQVRDLFDGEGELGMMTSFSYCTPDQPETCPKNRFFYQIGVLCGQASETKPEDIPETAPLGMPPVPDARRQP